MTKKVQKNGHVGLAERSVALPEAWRDILKDRLPALLHASRGGDDHGAIVAIRRLLGAVRELDEELAMALEVAVSSPELASASVRRASSVVTASEPISQEGSLPLMRRTSSEGTGMPILNEVIAESVADFLAEHRAADRLLRANSSPRYTVFLDGPPGVGKTALSQAIAAELGIPHYQIELSSVMSSLLGKTGQQIREVLDYARAHHVVLLLDEFDALAKRRDDANDLGELKRVVSILLKELEHWSGPSIIITATNYPSLIDPAMIRRFQLRLSLPPPSAAEIRPILDRYLIGFPAVPERILAFAARILAGTSGSDLRQLAQQVIRQGCLHPELDPAEIFLEALASRATSRVHKRDFCLMATEMLPSRHGSFARLARLLNISKSTVHNYVTKAPAHG